MYKNLSVGAVIPACNEEDNIGAVVTALLDLRMDAGHRVIDDLVVCDNGSTDATAQRAQAAGARMVVEGTPGYGMACLTAIAALHPVDVVLFVDGDQSFEVRQSLDLLAVIADGADLAIGSRALGRREPGALSMPQIAGNRVAGLLIRLLWGGGGCRPRPLSGPSRGRPAPAGHARYRLRLDSGNADQGDPMEHANCRDAGEYFSTASRHIEGRGNPEGRHRRQHRHSWNDRTVAVPGRRFWQNM